MSKLVLQHLGKMLSERQSAFIPDNLIKRLCLLDERSDLLCRVGATEKRTARNLPRQLSAARKAGVQRRVVGSHSLQVVPDDCSSSAVLCTSVSGFHPAETLEERKEGVSHSHCHTVTTVCLFCWKPCLIRFVIRKQFPKLSPKFCTWMDRHSFSAYVNDELSKI